MKAVVSAALAGERLDRVVALFAEVTRADAGLLVDQGSVEVNRTVATHRARRLAEGDEVDIVMGERAVVPEVKADAAVPFTVVFEDDAVIVVDKPAGVVVHPGAGNQTGTLVSGLLHRFPDLAALGEDTNPAGASRRARGGGDISPFRPGIVHRLDKGTAGLLVVGRTAEAVAGLQAQLADRSMHRTYTALSWGHFSAVEGRIDAPIGRSSSDPTKMAVVAAGRPARTRYRVEKMYAKPDAMSLLTCQLETGRTHQIRVHLSAIDHPVVGDPRYGGVKKAFPMKRPFLHAAALSFTHPVSGRPCTYEAPLPGDLVAVLAQLVELSTE